jgi:hypothetical protein
MAKKDPPRIGKDGWPVNAPSESAAARKRQFQEVMRWLRARWDATADPTVIVAAIRECVNHRQPPERWVQEATAELADLAMPDDEKRARRDWQIHLRRWEALVELRERRHELSERRLFEVIEGRLVENDYDDRGTSWERAREAVSESLAKDEAAGSASAVKSSYELVEKAGGKDATFESYKALLLQRPG